MTMVSAPTLRENLKLMEGADQHTGGYLTKTHHLSAFTHDPDVWGWDFDKGTGDLWKVLMSANDEVLVVAYSHDSPFNLYGKKDGFEHQRAMFMPVPDMWHHFVFDVNEADVLPWLPIWDTLGEHNVLHATAVLHYSPEDGWVETQSDAYNRLPRMLRNMLGKEQSPRDYRQMFERYYRRNVEEGKRTWNAFIEGEWETRR